jgi:predicted Zn finger-like uncharacterized protein
MTVTECPRCGAAFDVDRDGAVPGQDTTRCPECGESTTVPESDGGTASGGESSASATVTASNTDDRTLRLDVHLHVHHE